MNNSEHLVSLVMAVRNERGGLEKAVKDLDQITTYRFELIFVEGGSTDGTYEELVRLAALPHRHPIQVLRQDGVGKKDAVVKGLALAKGSLTFVFDNDGEISSAELPRFIELLRSDKNLFVNGNRFALPMEKRMRFVSRLGNKVFSILMSVATGNRLGDPLCGIKGAWTENYRKMIATGTFDNDIDRFAELDQLFGSRRLGLTVKELSVVYRNRRYGQSKVHHFWVGWQFLKRICLEYLYRFGFLNEKKFSVEEGTKKRAPFLRRLRIEYILFAAILLAVTVLSFRDILTYPRIWQDEAGTIELAHNVVKYGSPDIEVAPGKLTGTPHLIQSTGYPVFVPLALVFKVFGYGFTQARYFMLAWTLVALLAFFFLAKRFFGSSNALLALLLIASFSSFYNSSRTVVGEIPGFVFLLFGLAYLSKTNYVAAGLLFGLAIAAKPSVFGLIIPATVIVLLIHRAGFFRKLAAIVAGVIPTVVFWFIIVNRGIVDPDVFLELWRYYSNPFALSQSASFLSNTINFFYSPTLIYFTLLFLVIFSARLLNGRSRMVILYDFVLCYSGLAFLYYLRSPGWLRYILIAELLILFLLPHAVTSLSGRFLGRMKSGLWRKLPYVVVSLLVCVQLFRFATSANIFYSDLVIKTADYLNKEFPDESVAVVNSFSLAVLLNQDQKYKVVDQHAIFPVWATERAFIDPKPLLVQPPVMLMIYQSDSKILPADADILERNYGLVREMNGYKIYKLKDNNE